MTRYPDPPTRNRTPMDARIRARRNAVLRERARRRRRVVASIVALLALAGLAVGVARSPLFAIVEVDVRGVAALEQDEVLRVANLHAGDNLLSADLDAAAGRVRALPWVADAAARRIPPSTVELHVRPREPVVVVRLPDARWLVDAEGVVVAGGTRDGLPELSAPHSVVPGVGARVRDAALRNALAVVAQLPGDVRGQVERYEALSARDVRLHLRSGIVVRFGVADDVVAKARSVELLLGQAASQAQRRSTGADAPLGIAEIDVRAADNPVLVPAVQG